MTARVSLTKAQIARAIRAAKGEGMIALVTPQAVAFVESDRVALPSSDQAELSAYDAWKVKREGKVARRS